MLNSDVEEIRKQTMAGASEARRRGLVPQSGDWEHPKRWVRAKDFVPKRHQKIDELTRYLLRGNLSQGLNAKQVASLKDMVISTLPFEQRTVERDYRNPTRKHLRFNVGDTAYTLSWWSKTGGGGILTNESLQSRNEEYDKLKIQYDTYVQIMNDSIIPEHVKDKLRPEMNQIKDRLDAQNSMKKALASSTEKQHEAVKDVQRLYERFMGDPDFDKQPGETKKEAALDEAQDRVQQQINNQAVYELGKQMLSPAQRGLVFDEYKKRWVNPETEQAKKMGRNFMDMYRHYSSLRNRIESTPGHDPEQVREIARKAKEAWNAADKAQREAMHHIKIAKEEDRRFPKALRAMYNGIKKRGLDYIPEEQKWGKSMEKQAKNPFAVATAAAKEAGYEDFSEGSPGREKRGEIAEALKEGATEKAFEFWKQLQDPQSRGLVPKTGDPQHPGRWVRREQSENFQEALPRLLEMLTKKERSSLRRLVREADLQGIQDLFAKRNIDLSYDQAGAIGRHEAS